MQDFQELIEYQFRDISLLERALTHSSVNGKTNNERFEFLGDRVLGLIIAHWLLEKYPQSPEGELALMHNNLVNGKILAIISKRNLFQQFYIVGKSEKLNQLNDTIHANMMESIIAAIYLDSGIDSARKFVQKFWIDDIKNVNLRLMPAKSLLQEKCQKNGYELPVYTQINRVGPDHAPQFFVEVSCQYGKEIGEGATKQIAMTNAAQLLLDKLA